MDALAWWCAGAIAARRVHAPYGLWVWKTKDPDLRAGHRVLRRAVAHQAQAGPAASDAASRLVRRVASGGRVDVSLAFRALRLYLREFGDLGFEATDAGGVLEVVPQ